MGMKANSGFFVGTEGYYAVLFENMFYHISNDNKKFVDFQKLPESKGIEIQKRLTQGQMEYLTKKHGVEFAQIYVMGEGKNGRGGKYYLFSGDENSVFIPLSSKTILINHTHPRGTTAASDKDKKLLRALNALGSPQNTSTIYPIGKKPVKFGRERRRK